MLSAERHHQRVGVDVYESSGDPEPDDRFEAGALVHLVPGNRGRLLDARRTPVTLSAVSTADGTFEVRIDAFEDEGATWRVPLEDVGRYQFASAQPSVGAEELVRLRDAETRLNVPLVIAADEARADASLTRLAHESRRAARWLGDHMSGEVDVPARAQDREGDPQLAGLLERYMGELGLLDIEDAFARALVSNPQAGEIVKGHAIVLAELGLCPYDGKVIRDPGSMSGSLSRERRGRHVICRLAFSRALWERIGAGPPIYRAYASEGTLRAPAPASFISATLSLDVALSHFGGGPATRAAAIRRSPLDPARVFMSFLETRAMSERYREAEVLLIGGETL